MKNGTRNSLTAYATRRLQITGGKVAKHLSAFFYTVDPHAPGEMPSNFLSFAHYDYLGLGEEPAIRRAAQEAVETYGTSVGASRLVGGERALHQKLERSLADFIGTEDALAMVSGYGTNASVISHLLSKGDLIVFDSLAHNSVVAGVRGSRATALEFKHNNLDDLDAVLRDRRSKFGRVLVITEGLFSMDGDIPDLPRLISICREHDAWLMLDEAHSIGVLGETGRGLTEHFGIDPSEIDLIIGTMSKAFANCGGFICGSADVIKWLRFTLPAFVYSVGLPPAAAGGVFAALEMLKAQPERIQRVNAISRFFVEHARNNGFDVGVACGAGVVPILLPTTEQTMSASDWLMGNGIYVPPIVQIAVPKELPRLRFFLTAYHTREDVERVIATLCDWRAKMNLPVAAE